MPETDTPLTSIRARIDAACAGAGPLVSVEVADVIIALEQRGITQHFLITE